MKKILLLEDNYFMTETIQEAFEEKGWKYDRANKVVAAMNLFNKYDYDCIITDLVVNPLGLTEDEINKFQPLFGWAWLKNYLLKDERNASSIKQKTIIFSQYIKELKSKWGEDVKDLYLLSKSDDLELKKLLSQIEKIFQSTN